MDKLLNPKSIVVIGVSSREENLGKNILKNLINFEFTGKIYAVGTKNGSVFGIRIYESVLDVPDKIDLAVILAPARIVSSIIENCGKKGIKRAIILSGGFSEYEEEKKEIENELIKKAERYNMRFLGPNCQGVINARNGLCVPFPVMNKENFPPGHVSIIAQSGNVGILSAYLISKQNIGVNNIVSIGNKLNIDEVDFLSYFIRDNETKLIFLYLENIRNGRKFYDIIRKSKKPIIILKSNISPLSSNVAMSHTAALTTDDRIFDAAIKQAGAIRVKDLDEFVTCAKIFSMPYMQGNNIVIISPSGGYCVIGTDNCAIHKFNLPSLPSTLLNEVKKYGKAKVIKLSNPIDVGDIYDANAIYKTVKKVSELDNINGIVLSMFFSPKKEIDRFDTPFAGHDTEVMISQLKKLTEKSNKPITVSIISVVYDIDNKDYELPLFSSPVEAVKALAESRDYFAYLNKKEGKLLNDLKVDLGGVEGVLKAAKKEGKAYLGREAMEILNYYGIPVEMPEISTDIQSAIGYANNIGYPVAVKIHSENVLHKSDIGGVMLNISNDEELRTAYKKIKDNLRASSTPSFQLIIQKMVKEGKEVILGVKYDNNFGHVIMFGVGGIFVEVLEDITFKLPPISREDALEMIKEVKGFKILEGARGDGPYDILAICDGIVKLSKLIGDFPQIKEIDINPFIVFKEGMGGKTIDARIIL